MLNLSRRSPKGGAGCWMLDQGSGRTEIVDWIPAMSGPICNFREFFNETSSLRPET